MSPKIMDDVPMTPCTERLGTPLPVSPGGTGVAAGDLTPIVLLLSTTIRPSLALQKRAA